MRALLFAALVAMTSSQAFAAEEGRFYVLPDGMWYCRDLEDAMMQHAMLRDRRVQRAKNCGGADPGTQIVVLYETSDYMLMKIEHPDGRLGRGWTWRGFLVDAVRKETPDMPR